MSFLLSLASATSLSVYPPEANLESATDFQSVIVVETGTDGTVRDVTSTATYTLPKASPTVSFEKHILRPLSEGKANITISYGENTITLPVTVRSATGTPPVSFNRDVMPIFMKEGCNTGSCHGSSRGQDGFHLSLFGYDPSGDFHRLTRELSGRRLNLAIPEESLLLEKAVETVPHSGGKLFGRDSPPYRTLARWIQAGAPADPKDTPRPTGIEIFPPSLLMKAGGASQQMSIRAHYTDGSDRDVTALTVFASDNSRTASVSEGGLVTSSIRGESFITARFDAFTLGCQTIVVPETSDYERPHTKPANYIDTFTAEKLHKLRITSSGRCSDRTFLRRAHIDITGTLPTRKDYQRFVTDSSPEKRSQLVDTLLSRPEFVDIWVMKFSELLQIRTKNISTEKVSYKATQRYHAWLHERFEKNVPIDVIVRELLTAQGGTFENPPTNFFQIERDPLKTAENVAQVFMGIRLQCAQCHNHPFDRWTMDDYYGFAAFFARVGRKDATDPREVIIFDKGNGETKHPITKQATPPRFLGGELAETDKRDRRKLFATWLTSPENPYFATNLANIVWAHFFGIGIVEPVDDVRVSNPPSNPELLSALGQKFTGYGYDFRKLVRDICNSETYQRTTRPNQSNGEDRLNFSKSLIRRQRAEVLFDTISQATGVKNNFKGLPAGGRAVQIADGNTSNYFLKTFGRATRESSCSCEVKMEPNLSQALHLLNGDTVHNNIRRGGLVKNMIESGKTDAEILDAIYLRCYSRTPDTKEHESLLASLEEGGLHRQEYFEDIFWALLNSKEFLFNH